MANDPKRETTDLSLYLFMSLYLFNGGRVPDNPLCGVPSERIHCDISVPRVSPWAGMRCPVGAKNCARARQLTCPFMCSTRVTKPETVSEVFHLGVTRWISRKKNAVAATRAMEIVQKEIPTISLALRTSVPAAKAFPEESRANMAKEAILEVRVGDFSVIGGVK